MTEDELQSLVEAEELLAEEQKRRTLMDYTVGLINEASDGLLLGFGDNYRSVVDAALGRTPEGELFNYEDEIWDRYDKSLKHDRQTQGEFREDNPIASTTANVVGGFATPSLGVASGISSLNKAKTVGQAIKSGVAGGSAFGAAAGAGFADDDPNLLNSAFVGGLTGGVFGGAVGGALHKTNLVQPNKKSLAKTEPPKVIDLKQHHPDAPANLQSLETQGDLEIGRFYDQKLPLKRMLDRAEPYLPFKWSEFDINTGTEVSRKINNYSNTGKLVTPEAVLETRTTPKLLIEKARNMPDQFQADFNNYLHLKDQLDDMRIAANNPKHEMHSYATSVVNSLGRRVASLRKQYEDVPEFAEMERDVREITNSILDFIGSGDGAMLSPKEIDRLRKERPNYIPLDISNVDPSSSYLDRIGQAAINTERVNIKDSFLMKRQIHQVDWMSRKRTPALESLHDYTLNVLKYSSENQQRLKFIRAMQSSKYGSDTIRPATKAEKGTYKNRLVRVYEGGEPIEYIGSQLQTDLLQLDPNVVKVPILYGPRRMFELGNTGWGNPGFAATVFLRDTLAAPVLNQAAAGPLATAAVVPEAAFRQGQQALSRSLRSGVLRNIPIVDTKKFADELSDSYMKSWYNLANEQGGVEASLSRNQIEIARGMLTEAAKPFGDGYNSKYALPIRVPVQTALSFMDLLKEAPRYATVKKMIKEGMEPHEAVLFARQITGDASKQGIQYKATGERIAADTVLGSKGRIISSTTSPVATLLKEGTPWYNPSIRGMTKLAVSLRDDPVGTMARNWLYVGMPTLGLYLWNEMGGPEYNNFNMEQSTGYNRMMFQGIRIPGLPPEQMAQVPLAHENAILNAPFRQAIHNVAREDRELLDSMGFVGQNMIENSVMLAPPALFTSGAGMLGVRTPGSIGEVAAIPFGGDFGYSVREDHSGILDENMELFVRQTFGALGDTVYESLNAITEGGVEAGLQEAGIRLARGTPLIRDQVAPRPVAGSFYEDSDAIHQKGRALSEAVDIGKSLYGDPVTTSKDVPDDKGLLDGVPDTPRRLFAPSHVDGFGANNFLRETYELINNAINKNTQGFSGLKGERNKLRKQVRHLTKMNQGSALNRMSDWQSEILEGIDDEKNLKAMQKELESSQKEFDAKYKGQALGILDPKRAERGKLTEKIKMLGDKIRAFEGDADRNLAARIILDNNLDLTSYKDRRLLISELNKRLQEVRKAESTFYTELEQNLTTIARQHRYIDWDEKIDLSKHLDPNRKMQRGQVSASPSVFAQ